jgi:hypothetical protein
VHKSRAANIAAFNQPIVRHRYEDIRPVWQSS